jgi:hypothetical protein
MYSDIRIDAFESEGSGTREVKKEDKTWGVGRASAQMMGYYLPSSQLPFLAHMAQKQKGVA